MAHKNNKKNRRRAAFYRISKFNYKVREKLTEGQPLLKKTLTEEKVVKHSSGNAWTEDWIPKITIVQTNSWKV